ncbi:hypothetical protein VP01_1050g8 [Puccinia sorghi]|uniref:Uncharacterized protein n=1 Tax=Puccinia sorghi TaxID=27349 RepID=A0A0L6VU49_9BASI|nr:hypothetical protein VP01_1050g8 [Puccinia sorghi]
MRIIPLVTALPFLFSSVLVAATSTSASRNVVEDISQRYSPAVRSFDLNQLPQEQDQDQEELSTGRLIRASGDSPVVEYTRHAESVGQPGHEALVCPTTSDVIQQSPSSSRPVQSADSLHAINHHPPDEQREAQQQQPSIPTSSSSFSSRGLKRPERDSTRGLTSRRRKKVALSTFYDGPSLLTKHTSDTRKAPPALTKSRTTAKAHESHNSIIISASVDKVTRISDEPAAEGKIFSLNDWQFLRMEPLKAGETDPHQKEYLRFLQECKGANSSTDTEQLAGRFKSIEREAMGEFMDRYLTQRAAGRCVYPTLNRWRHSTFPKQLLRLSDDKIKLARYNLFSEGIMRNLKQRITTRLDSFPEHRPKRRLQTFMQFVQKVTKTTHYLIIIVMAFFNEHPNDFLMVSVVKEIVAFLKQLWVQLDEGSFPDLHSTVWALKAHQLLNVDFHNAKVDRLLNHPKNQYEFCWSIVIYWLDQNPTWPSSSSIHDKPAKLGLQRAHFSEIINKLIFFSDFDHMATRVKK